MRTGSLREFIDEFIVIVNEEVKDDTLWQIYLHKVVDMSYQEFLDKCKTSTVSNDEPVDFETAASNSMCILEDFIPE